MSRKYTVPIKREIIFKKYNPKKQGSWLQMNVDIIPEDINKIYADSNGNKDDNRYFILLANKNFKVYNEDAVHCGSYDYDNQIMTYSELPLKPKPKPTVAKPITKKVISEIDEDIWGDIWDLYNKP